MAGHTRLPMAGLAKLNDDQEDPNFLEKYLMPPDGLPREPETADGMLVMGMAQGDEEVLFKVPRLSERAPAARGYTYAKLVIGKYKDFDMELSVRRTADGGLVPRVTAGRYIVSGERRLPVNEDLCPDERLLGMQIWLDTRRDTGLNGKECLQYYQNWLVRVWRSFFPQHPIYKLGRRTANDDKSSGPTDSGQKKRKANAATSEDDPLNMPSKKHKGQKRSARDLSAGGDDPDDKGVDQENMDEEDEAEGEDEKELIQRYRLSSVVAFWTSYEEDGKENLDLDDEKVCEMIGQGFLEFKQSSEGTDPPPMSVLKAARDEYRKFQAAAPSVEHTFAFRTWNLQMTTGTRKPPRVEKLPSLYKVDEANRKKQQQKQELQRKEDGQWLRKYLLRNGVSEDAMRAVDKIAHRLKDVDV
ncbi:hypothetical protein KC318_g3838 [Hortaea werneckii]|nr:hypothetical protein KC334_g2157 [Hortaea werneckii]KAI7022956.1 hypothetical protein KC355_g1880 [Hortaea werneckii]KAI7670815.1 hypothetical protein KC318_g3838 [Hortaea werneckii]